LDLVNEIEKRISIKHWDIRLCILHSLFSFFNYVFVISLAFVY
jgi:hypothetical protein